MGNLTNELEMLPTDEGIACVVTKPSGEISVINMTWEEFRVLQTALDRDK